MKSKPSFVCYGEILWDIFPSTKHLGGAPLNVGLRLASLCQDNSVSIISALGQDALADKALQAITATTLNTGLIQRNQYPTGTVQVSLSRAGNASYQICESVAWDHIKPTPAALEHISDNCIFVFGSLAARSATSYNTLIALAKASSFSVFDVNLRAPYFSWKLIYELLLKANFVKMNEEELPWICQQLSCPKTTLEEQLRWLQKKITTPYLCVTLGAQGACLLNNGVFVKVPGVKAEVKDTVGAGDSFLATLLWALFYKQQAVHLALKNACIIGAMVASEAGANPVFTKKVLESVLIT